MSDYIKNLLHSHIATIVRIARQEGVILKVGTDFHEFVQICKNTPGKGEVSPAFNPSKTDINASTGIWVVGYRENGEVVHTQATKILALGGGTLADYFQQSLADIQIGGMNVNAQNSPWDLSRAASGIAGTVTYHGEVWLKGGPDGFRGGCLSAVLSRLILIITWLRWAPDYMIGIQAIRTACGGLGVRQGYTRVEAGSVRWNIVGKKNPIEGWLVWMNRDDAYHNLRVPPEVFYELYGGQALPEAETIYAKSA